VGCNFFKWWCEEDVDEKDVIIMTQRRQINDLEKSLKVAEKRLQLVIGFTCVVIVLFVLLLCVIF